MKILGGCTPAGLVSWTGLILMLQIWIRGVSAQLRFYNTRTTNKCFNVVGIPHLDFSECKEDELIVIHEAFQGVSADPKQCSYTRGDCIESSTPDTDTKLNDECVGMATCSITVGVAWMRKCNAYSRYNHANYQCIPRADILDICQSSRVSVSRTAFLMSPAYPKPYPPHVDCRCNITTQHDQRILLKFSDFTTRWSQACEEDVVEIQDGDAKMPRCGRLPRNYNLTSTTSRVGVRFVSSGWQQHKGFLLTLEALGSMDITCGSNRVPTPTPTTTQDMTTYTEVTTTATYDYDDNDVFVNENLDNVESFGGFFLSDGFLTSKGFPTLTQPDYDLEEYYDLTTEEPQTEKNHLSALVAIVVGIVLLSALILGMAAIAIWLRKRRHKEEISKLPEEAHYPRLQHHRPTQHTSIRGQHSTASFTTRVQHHTPNSTTTSGQHQSSTPVSIKSNHKERKSRLDFERVSSVGEMERKVSHSMARTKDGRKKRSKSRGKTVHYT